jgi:hypothetical protein
MRTARMLGQSLKAATRVVHHVSQNVARSGINDQYAGRGGTAFADNSRSQHQIRRLTDRKLEHEGSTYILPASVSDEALAGAPGLRVLAIFTHKLSYSQRDSTPIILIRRGFAFEHVPIERLDKSPLADAERRDHDRFKVLDFIGERLGVGIKLTKDELVRHGGTLGMTRQELRDARDSLLTMKLLNLKALPKDEQRTKRKTYLAPGGQPNPANPAEFRRNPAGGITKQGGTAAANPAADGTSIRRRDLKPKKPAKHRNDKEAVFGRIPPSVTGKKRMNGKAAYHA